MNIFYTDQFVLPLPDKHRFPMVKYARLRHRVFANALVPAENMCIPDPATDEQLTLAHHLDYVLGVQYGTLTPKEIRKIGFPWTPGLAERSRRSVGGTISAARSALVDGLGVSLAGGTHHAFFDSGGGYCVFNDAVVALRVLLREGRIQRAVIIDCDVHHGDGTASLCADDPRIFTFSIHGQNNYPFHKPPSDLDVGLPDETSDADYLAALREGLAYALQHARADLAIYLAGADPFVGDTLGRLSVSKEGLLKRDQLVLESCLTARIPVAIVMAGGYAKDVDDTVDIHFQTVSLASRISANH